MMDKVFFCKFVDRVAGGLHKLECGKEGEQLYNDEGLTLETSA